MTSQKLFLQNCDDQVLDNYLKLLAYTAQNTASEHAIMALKFENSELKIENSALIHELNKTLDDLFFSENPIVQAELIARLQKYIVERPVEQLFFCENSIDQDKIMAKLKQYLLGQITGGIKSFFKSGFSK